VSAPETVRVAPGVELVLLDQAGPEARRIAEEIQRTYAAELISARPAPMSAFQKYGVLR